MERATSRECRDMNHEWTRINTNVITTEDTEWYRRSIDRIYEINRIKPVRAKCCSPVCEGGG